MKKWIWIVLAILGAVTAIVLVYPAVVFMLMFSLGRYVGWPAVILLFVPTIFFYVVVLLGSYYLLRRYSTSIAWLGACIAVVVLAVVVPLLANQSALDFAESMIAGDRALAAPLGKVHTLAYLRPDLGWPQKDAYRCDGICQRLLYNRTVVAVLVGPPATDPDQPVQPHLARYQIEHRETCPSIDIPDAGTWGSEQPPQSSAIVSDRVKARIAAGECLVRDRGELSQADVVVANRDIFHGAGRLRKPKHTILMARRVSLYRPEDGNLVEVFRRTELKMRLVEVPMLYLGPPGLLAKVADFGGYDLGRVLAFDFGLNVGIPAEVSPSDVRAMLRAAIADKDRPADDPAFWLADQILHEIGIDGPTYSDDVELVGAIIADNRVRSQRHLSGAISRIGVDSAPLASPLLDRLLASDPRAEASFFDAIESAILALPDGALQPEMDKLKRLAADKARRGKVVRALSRLADAGPENVPLLVELLRDGRNADRNRDGYHSKDLAIGALIGLCRLGKEAKEAGPELVVLLNSLVPQKRTLSRRARLSIRVLALVGQSSLVPEKFSRWRDFELHLMRNRHDKLEARSCKD